ncbi:MAG: hypothetical protein M1371_00565 [Actinobacteria bacterium]|nr:hypothetical protein [Actinomycetota bacterium]MCL5985039.1 hypothetical protein [Actinomycetota bacterium]
MLIAKKENIAEAFANYTYGYLVFGLLFILIDKLRERVKEKNRFVIFKKIMLSLIFFSLLFSNYLIFPLILPEYKSIQPFELYTSLIIPRAYKWLKNQPHNFIIAEYPLLDEKGEIYSDYIYMQKIHGKNLFNLLLRDKEKSKLLLESGFEKNINEFINGLGSKKMAEMLGYYGVRYLLLHKDKIGVELSKEAKNKLDGFKLVYSDEKSDIFEIDESLQKPTIYPINNIRYFSRSLGLLYIPESLKAIEFKDNKTKGTFNYFPTGDEVKDNEVLNISNEVIVPIDISYDVLDSVNGNEGVLYGDLNLVPSQMKSKSAYSIPLYVFNAGSRTWPNKQEENSVHLSYHWLDVNTKDVVVFDGVRTNLPRSIIPGEVVRVDVEVKTPEEPGDYILQFDLVREKEYWFSWKGVKPLSKDVKVVSNQEAEDVVFLDQEEDKNNIINPEEAIPEYFEFNKRNYSVAYSFSIIKEGEYSFYLLKSSPPDMKEIRFSLDGKGWIDSYIDILNYFQEASDSEDPFSQETSTLNNNSKYIIKLLDVYLNKGNHQIVFFDSRFFLDRYRFKDSDFLVLQNLKSANKDISSSINIQSGTASSNEYKIEINTNYPFPLAINEVYHKTLEAYYTDGKKIDIFSNPGYSILYFDKVGKYDVIIKFSKDKIIETGKEIYFFWAIFILCIVFTIIVWGKPNFEKYHT